MKFAIVSGSHRTSSQSEKVARFIQAMITSHFASTDVFLLSLAGNLIPLWDEEAGADAGKWRGVWSNTSVELTSADAIIVVSPEWGGMVPAGLKNFFLMCANRELAHKPGLIVTVSAGMGGSYPVAELRMSSYKNTHLCYIPEHVIIRHANDVLNDPSTAASNTDTYLRKRLHYALEVLHLYAQAFQAIRASSLTQHKDFPYGM